jgi:plastocyanin domain-containing protein
MSSKELPTESEENEMLIRSFGKIFGGTAAMLLLATSLCLPINVHAQRRGKRKLPAVQKVTVALTEKGYEPASLKLRRGIPAQVTFLRKVSATCGTQIVLPDYDIKRALPLNEPVLVEFTPNKTGTFAFTCGMGMLRGSLIVR